MSIYGRLQGAGIDVSGPGGLTGFNNPVRFFAGAVGNLGIGDVYYLDAANGADTNSTSVYGITPHHSDQSLEAVSATDFEAEWLGCETGSSLMFERRLVFDECMLRPESSRGCSGLLAVCHVYNLIFRRRPWRTILVESRFRQ